MDFFTAAARKTPPMVACDTYLSSWKFGVFVMKSQIQITWSSRHGATMWLPEYSTHKLTSGGSGSLQEPKYPRVSVPKTCCSSRGRLPADSILRVPSYLPKPLHDIVTVAAMVKHFGGDQLSSSVHIFYLIISTSITSSLTAEIYRVQYKNLNKHKGR